MKRNLLKLALCAMAALPLGAWADVTTVGTRVLWTFNELSTGDLTSNTSGANSYVIDQLLYTGNTGSSIIELESSGTFSDGTPYSTTKGIQLQSNTSDWSSIFSSQRTGENYSGYLARSLAFNTTVPGTCYVIFSRSGSVESGKTFDIYFNYRGATWTSTNATKPVSSSQTEVSLYGATAGTFWIRAGQQSRIHAILFVPSVNKEIGSHEWSTFSNNYSFGLKIPSGVKVYGASGYDSENKQIVLTEYSDVIPANTGVVLNGTEGTYNFEYTTADGTYDASDNYMVAVTSTTTIKQDEIVLMWDNSESKIYFWKVQRGDIDSDTWSSIRPRLNAGQAYLSSGVLSVSARGFGIGFDEGDDNTTGIKNAGKKDKTDTYYSLQGERFNNPSKGIYIKDGKKVVIK